MRHSSFAVSGLAVTFLLTAITNAAAVVVHAPAPAADPEASVGSHPMFDLNGFVGDWHSEWRKGDHPRYTDTHTNTWRYDDVQSKEDYQSDGKSSVLTHGSEQGAYLPDELRLEWDKKPGPGA